MGKTANKRRGPAHTPGSSKKGRPLASPSPPPAFLKGPQRDSPPSPTPSTDSSVTMTSNYSSSDSESNKSAPTTKPPPAKTTEQQIPTTAKPKQIRPPPLILNSASWRKIAPIIYKLPNFTPSAITAKTTSNGQITVQTTDPTHFRQVQKVLVDSKTEFHTFSLPEDRSLKVVLKGIPTDITTDDLKSELEILNFETKYIRRFGTPEKPMPMCLVHIAATPNAKDIFLLNSLFYLTISVEALKPSGPAQCFSCQRFGHGSRNCGHPPRCVKCAGNHLASECQKTPEQTPTCCNCGGPHTANFRGCPHLLTLKPKNAPPPTTKPQTLPPTTQSFTPPPPPPTTTLKPQTRSYAAATTGQAPPPPKPTSPEAPQINLSLILNLLTNLLTAITNNQDPKTLIQTTIQTFLTILSPQNG